MNYAESSLSHRYFVWLCRLVRNKAETGNLPYSKLLERLHERDFNFSHPMDANRADDGINLRYRFGYDEGASDIEIANLIDIHPCSVLEMMVALSVRCETFIMGDRELGDRTGKWFWGMIRNLGLIGQNDMDYDERYVDICLDVFMNREYEFNGKGGLFTIHNTRYDMRSLDIWYQMMRFLNEAAVY